MCKYLKIFFDNVQHFTALLTKEHPIEFHLIITAMGGRAGRDLTRSERGTIEARSGKVNLEVRSVWSCKRD